MSDSNTKQFVVLESLLCGDYRVHYFFESHEDERLCEALECLLVDHGQRLSYVFAREEHEYTCLKIESRLDPLDFQSDEMYAYRLKQLSLRDNPNCAFYINLVNL